MRRVVMEALHRVGVKTTYRGGDSWTLNEDAIVAAPEVFSQGKEDLTVMFDGLRREGSRG